MSKKQKEEKPLTEEQAAKRAAGIAATNAATIAPVLLQHNAPTTPRYPTLGTASRKGA